MMIGFFFGYYKIFFCGNNFGEMTCMSFCVGCCNFFFCESSLIFSDNIFSCKRSCGRIENSTIFCYCNICCCYGNLKAA